MRLQANSLIILLSAAVLPLALAQEPRSPGEITFQIAEHEELGPHLTDGEGRTLYGFINDEAAEPYQEPHLSTCYEECAQNWPPLVVEAWPPPEGQEGIVAEGLDIELVATVEREDDTIQLTYGNWPLYYFARDENPGDVNGQGIGDVWYVIAPDGTLIGREDRDATEAPAEPAPEGAEESEPAPDQEADPEQAPEGEQSEDQGDGAAEEEREGAPEGGSEGEPAQAPEGDGAEGQGMGADAHAALMSEGETVFASNCATCHGEGGEGDVGPALTQGTSTIESSDRLIRQILRGSEMMPGFRQLSDRQIAAVATFVRNSWENDYGTVAEGEVSEWR